MVLVSTKAAIERAAPHGLVFTLVGAISLGTFALVCAPHYAKRAGAPGVDGCLSGDGYLDRLRGLVCGTEGGVESSDEFSVDSRRRYPRDVFRCGDRNYARGTRVRLLEPRVGTHRRGALRFLIVAWKNPMRQWLWRVSWDGTLARQLGSYGLANTGAVLLWYTHTNGDYVVMENSMGQKRSGSMAKASGSQIFSSKGFMARLTKYYCRLMCVSVTVRSV